MHQHSVAKLLFMKIAEKYARFLHENVFVVAAR